MATTAVQTGRIAAGMLGTTMANPTRPMSRTALVGSLLAVGLGLVLLLIGLGVIPVDPRSVNGPMWLMSAAGLAFMLAGISASVGTIHGVSATGELPKDASWWMRVFYYVLGLAVVVALASIGTWVAFGPGPRAFSGSGMAMVPSDTVGRIVFGFGAVLTWLIAGALAVSGARKLFFDRSQ